MTTEKIGLSIVMPAFDEEAGITHAIRAALDAGDRLEARVGRTEVVVVDDGSRDATATIVAALAALEPRVVLVRHDRQRGLGAAVTSALDASRGALVCYTDADLPFDLSELDRALEILATGDADLVSAFRNNRHAEGWRRSVYSFVYNALVRAAFGLRVRDVNFAAKVLSREVVDILDLRSEGSFIDVELLARAHRHGFRIAQYGVDYRPREQGTSTLSSPSVIRDMLRELVQLRPGIVRPAPTPGIGATDLEREETVG